MHTLGTTLGRVKEEDDKPGSQDPDFARLLDEVGAGRARASEELLPLVYEQLRAVAAHQMGRERRDHTLQATALVHEAYLRLAGDTEIGWDNRAHFFGAAARAMRRIVIEHARARGRLKRGGDARRVPLSNVVDLLTEADAAQALAVDEAIERLALQDPRMAEIVQLRFFAGMSVDQTARALQISERTVRREWALARAWLTRELAE